MLTFNSFQIVISLQTCTYTCIYVYAHTIYLSIYLPIRIFYLLEISVLDDATFIFICQLQYVSR